MAAVLMRERERQSRSIPTDAEFAAAGALMDRRLQAFAEVRTTVFRLLPDVPLHEVYLFGSPEGNVHAHVFYMTEADVESCSGNGISRQVHDAILAAFMQQEPRSKPKLMVEYHSHEHVQKTCNGNYFKYLK